MKFSTTFRDRALPGMAFAVLLAALVFQLRAQGRIFGCACGRPFLWAGDIWSSHNSQHLFDPYSFTHVLHGVLLCGVLRWMAPRVRGIWRLWLAVAMEAGWEILENTPLIIDRYRTATIGLGYTGDSIVNSLGDITCCALGFLLARRLGWRLSVFLFIGIEALLLIWIRDNLTLNMLMLIHPIEAIKTWQMIH